MEKVACWDHVPFIYLIHSPVRRSVSRCLPRAKRYSLSLDVFRFANEAEVSGNRCVFQNTAFLESRSLLRD